VQEKFLVYLSAIVTAAAAAWVAWLSLRAFWPE
jgi:hypothetical protein